MSTLRGSADEFVYRLVGGPLDGVNVSFPPGQAPDALTDRPRVYTDSGTEVPAERVLSRRVYRLVGDPGGKAVYVYDHEAW